MPSACTHKWSRRVEIERILVREHAVDPVIARDREHLGVLRLVLFRTAKFCTPSVLSFEDWDNLLLFFGFVDPIALRSRLGAGLLPEALSLLVEPRLLPRLVLLGSTSRSRIRLGGLGLLLLGMRTGCRVAPGDVIFVVLVVAFASRTIEFAKVLGLVPGAHERVGGTGTGGVSLPRFGAGGFFVAEAHDLRRGPTPRSWFVLGSRPSILGSTTACRSGCIGTVGIALLDGLGVRQRFGFLL
mmetsp:Transcript_11919/g.25623  ORF Transcript_11919/g.25623 Transcript_11919/m.25623 type:complete len:242 (+) Transcript_11919:210-935(+)